MYVIRIPPKRTGVDLSHVTLNPDGTRSSNVAALKRRPEVKRQLDAIRERRDAARDQGGNQ